MQVDTRRRRGSISSDHLAFTIDITASRIDAASLEVLTRRFGVGRMWVARSGRTVIELIDAAAG